MKIIGGSFGVKGSAYISRGALAVEGARKVDYLPADVRAVRSQVVAEKKFGVLGALVGGVLLAVILAAFLGPLGVLLGAALAIAGSFYSAKRNVVDLEFTDGNTLSLECTPKAVDKLVRFKG